MDPIGRIVSILTAWVSQGFHFVLLRQYRLEYDRLGEYLLFVAKPREASVMPEAVSTAFVATLSAVREPLDHL